ncbi:MAG: bifunctional (p)ppGpp synthetase/guanosine-3',5'-bis(diphosphate) 3'-pyrophosphohydrolase [Bacteroidota bacterium]|nr:bifunctional (p)ppGpp synthetase/guanosine-3',5'-bis(diphosphate) 3'-pyrophosphohydrolase [Bacteroidota bacterium]MDX5428650.1 bifunctional (p)ppGpp synthetase/guanosine-3',5'-bis(diphosphate) 3'-pyrophosphohydrolase [Bacteroidota bacterium]MDX5448392.1 bifunctional (p)ppGpp synthetase/guanosine-3',5'-bis(diphosphate) 3'-pyrophosphohydrolase [Bacteroidota bacterium]MDX5506387.1 bifunctional (p)ppGpp synthetase/guanosine-3',5'-bis(diphosphate) 3'-pyrophosphohydrolase [Bacteroidota bacterium]
MAEISTDQNNKEIVNRYRALLRAMEGKADAKDKRMVRRAFDLAMDAHKGIVRKSGEPYILHPIEVAIIVAKEIGLGPTSIACALIHDVVEDSDYTLEDIERLFGEKVARVIDGLTKISGVFDQNVSVQAENFRKMLLTISDDIRVILIKIADRLHNMRTLDHMPAHKQLKIASETLFIYAPLSHRLGLYNIKLELEDLSLKYTEPEVYRDIALKIKASKAGEIKYLKRFSSRIRDSLKKEGFNFTIKERTKSIFSIRRKMVNQGVSFDEVYDKFAIRIIVESPPEREKADCWKVYSIVTDYYRPNPDRLRDWISAPKSNGYESLHTTVMGPEGHWVEVQIRSRRMDEIAEKGYAAHWKYKEDSSTDDNLEKWITRVRDLLENPDSNAVDFIDNFKLNLFSDEIFLFTPEGDMKILPKGASPLDFAFEIHTDIGSHTLGAKVNGKLVPLSYQLKSGDQVEILTSEKQHPKEDWLNYVVTAKARSKIRQSLKDERKRIADKGQHILQRKLSILKIKMTESVVQKMVNYFKVKTPTDLYYKVGMGIIDNRHLKEFTRDNSGGLYSYIKSKLPWSGAEKKGQKERGDSVGKILVFGNDDQQLDYKLAKCCNPIPGDKVFGFVTSNEGIKVHRSDCPNAISLQSKFANRTIKARWINSEQMDFTANLLIKGIDTVGLVNQVTQIISNDLSVNIRSINISGEEGVFEGNIILVVQDKIHLQGIIDKLRKVEGVTSIERKTVPARAR